LRIVGDGKEKTFIFHQSSGDSDRRLDRFLSAKGGLDLSRARIQNLITIGAVTVNGEIRRASYHLRSGDRVRISIPPPSVPFQRPKERSFDLLYQDNSILVVNKPPGLLVHPSAGHPTGTLVDSLASKYSSLSSLSGLLRPGIVHRLDKDTSGVMVIARDDRTHNFLATQFKRRQVRKRYLAIVHGKVEGGGGKLDLPIGRHPVKRKQMSVSLLDGRRSISEWEVISIFSVGFTLLRIILRTGRTHQIRVHMAYMGYPVLGDAVYGYGKRWWNQQSSTVREALAYVRRQMLHAELLGFIHPDTLRYVEFVAPPPADMVLLLGWLSGNRML
jgi:23S rRNA pseudouridine1911/1915/1917 synthase